MLFWRNRHEVRDEELNALVDGELDESARLRVERHIELCLPCSEAVAELRAVSRAISELPAVPAPRSFALRRADVEPAQTPAPSRLFDSVQPLLSGVAAMAIVAFVVLVGVDVTGNGGVDFDNATSGGMSLELGDQTSLAPEVAAATGQADDSCDNDSAYDTGEEELTTEDAAAPRAADYDDERSSENEANGITSDTDKPAAPERDTVPGEDVRGPQAGDRVEEFGHQGGIAAAPAADDGNTVGLRVAESVAAAVALTAGGSVLLIWWRRRATAG